MSEEPSEQFERRVKTVFEGVLRSGEILALFAFFQTAAVIADSIYLTVAAFIFQMTFVGFVGFQSGNIAGAFIAKNLEKSFALKFGSITFALVGAFFAALVGLQISAAISQTAIAQAK